MNFLSEKKNDLFDLFLDDYGNIFNIDKKEAKRLLKTNELFHKLTDEWYVKLNSSNKNSAYRVYDDEYYFVDIFNCFVTYSRDYIKRIKKSKAYEDLKDIKSYVDIGCGISYSTCALKQLFPNAKAYAINLRETKQWKFCEFMSEKYGYTLVDSIDSINEKVDLVFASEYFEHIENPTKHFDEIVTAIDPDWFVIANAFNTHSIGHYEKYYYNDQIIDQSKINLIFNKHIRESNFKDMNYSIWNNKPKIWKKTKDTNLMEFL